MRFDSGYIKRNWHKLFNREQYPLTEPILYKDRKLVYTDKFDNKWYEMTEGTLPAERTLYGWIYSNDLQFGLTVEQRQTMRDKRKAAINAEPVDRVVLGSLVEVEEAAEKLYCQPAILMNLATVYYLLNDEEPESMLEHVQKEKYDIFERDNECKSFFLQRSYLTIRKSLDLPQSNVQDYLKKVKPVLDLIKLKTQ